MTQIQNLKQTLIPTVIDQEEFGERSYDIYSRLLKDRIIFLGKGVNDDTANSVVAQLLLLDQQDDEKDIYLYINSPGGSVSAGFAILDTMNYVKADVQTICVGQAASMGAILVANGAKGKRLILPHASIMIHQPWTHGLTGQVTDIEIEAKELTRIKTVLTKILADKTGQPYAKLKDHTERDYWMNAGEAVKYGIVDHIVHSSVGKTAKDVKAPKTKTKPKSQSKIEKKK